MVGGCGLLTLGCLISSISFQPVVFVAQPLLSGVFRTNYPEVFDL
jgi:hypothetical protein